MVDIIVIGSVGLDDVETPFGEVMGALGGSASYFSVAASMFANVGIISVVGNDFPNEYINLFESRNINLQGLKILEGYTFRWKASYLDDINSAKTLATELNTWNSFSPEVPGDYLDSKFVFLGNIDPDMQMQVLNQVKPPKAIALDTMNFWIKGKRESLLNAISKVNIVFMNDSEAKLLFRTQSLINAAKEVLEMGPGAVVIKRGEHGASLFTKNSYFSAPAYPVENVVDPTGAGDSFSGGFMGWLAKTSDLSEKNMRKAVIYGSVMASFNTEGFSLDNLKKINITDIQNRYNEFKQVVHFE